MAPQWGSDGFWKFLGMGSFIRRIGLISGMCPVCGVGRSPRGLMSLTFKPQICCSGGHPLQRFLACSKLSFRFNFTLALKSLSPDTRAESSMSLRLLNVHLTPFRRSAILNIQWAILQISPFATRLASRCLSTNDLSHTIGAKSWRVQR